MYIYILLIIATMLIQSVPTKTDQAYKFKLFFSFVPIFLFGALRQNFGLDYSTYESDYHLYHSVVDWFNAIDRDEKGYAIFVRLMPSWRMLICVQSFLVCGSYGYIFYKYVPRNYLWLAFALLFLSGDRTIFFMFSGIRNSIAITIMLFSISLIIKRRLVAFLICTFIAMSFHTSAVIVMSILYIICGRHIISKRELVLWSFVILFLVITPWDNFVRGLMPFMNHYFLRYDYYINNALEMGDSRSIAVYASSLLMSAGLLLSAYRSKKFEESVSLKKLAVIFPCADLLGTLNGRLYLYVSMFIIIAVVQIINNEENKQIKWGTIAVIVFYLYYSFFNVFLHQNAIAYFPYQSIFN